MNLYQQIDSNKRKTWMLMIGFLIFIGIVGYVIGEVWYGNTALVVPFIAFSTFANIGAYFFSDSIALSMAGARAVTKEEETGYYNLVENLTIATGLPMPKLHVIETPAMNAFATGRDPKHASIAVTRGLLEKLDKRELEGVLAHELSHIKNFDIRLMTIVVVLVGIIAMLTQYSFRFGGGNRDNNKGGGAIIAIVGIVLVILAPIIANIIKFAVSRQREYLADASAAYITRYPGALASALQKISIDPNVVPHANSATAHLFISDPLKSFGSRVSGLFSTHPPVEERIARLQAM